MKIRTEQSKPTAELPLAHCMLLGRQPYAVLILRLVHFNLCLNLLIAQHQAAKLDQGAPVVQIIIKKEQRKRDL